MNTFIGLLFLVAFAWFVYDRLQARKGKDLPPSDGGGAGGAGGAGGSKGKRE
jgi:hypothetical protein